jgi:dipeptidyl aminopeptidase/acylaminoacyl peptidase
VLIIYSAQDTTVPPKEQSIAMAERLKSSGKDVTLVEIPGDDHHLHSSASRIRMLEATDAFLAKNLPVAP